MPILHVSSKGLVSLVLKVRGEFVYFQPPWPNELFLDPMEKVIPIPARHWYPAKKAWGFRVAYLDIVAQLVEAAWFHAPEIVEVKQ